MMSDTLQFVEQCAGEGFLSEINDKLKEPLIKCLRRIASV